MCTHLPVDVSCVVDAITVCRNSTSVHVNAIIIFILYPRGYSNVIVFVLFEKQGPGLHLGVLLVDPD